MVLNRLNVNLDQTGPISEIQYGFRKDRRTIDMIFIARQFQEKSQEQNVDLYMATSPKHSNGLSKFQSSAVHPDS